MAIKIELRGNGLILLGGVFLTVIMTVFVILYLVGRTYQTRIASVSEQKQPQPMEHTVREEITKITVKNTSNDCIEFTRDGAARTLVDCGEEIASAQRLTDTRSLNRMFKIIAETNFTAVPSYQSDQECDGYIITIYTISGFNTVCLSPYPDNQGNQTYNQFTQVIDDIVDIIDDVIAQLEPTPTILMPTPTGTIPTVHYLSTPTPTLPVGIGTPTPTVTGTPISAFICDYTEGSTKKPYSISNIICSSGPTPGP